jgi:uncharacterized membrane protein YbhN (UPF0104 family)
MIRARFAAGVRRWHQGGVMALAFALAIGALHVAFRHVTWSEIAVSLRQQPTSRLLVSLGLTALSFAGIASYDAVNVEIVAQGRVPRRLALLAGATGAAIANTVGFHAVSGTAVRAHLYLPAGLRSAEVARVMSLSWLSLFAGNVAMLAVAELVQAASDKNAALHVAIGAALVAVLLSFGGWLAGAPRELVVGRFRFPMPSASQAAVQVVIGAVESGAAIGALYVLLPADLTPPFSLFAVGCIAAATLGALAHTPGGIGVFEASLTALLSGRGRSDLLAALLLFRMIFNLLPFVLSVTVLGALAGARGMRARRE